MQGRAAEPKNSGTARWRALWQSLVAFAVAALFLWRHRPRTAMVLFAVGGVVLVSGLFIPPLFRRIEKAGQWLGKWFGMALTWVLLAPLFYLVFLPGRIILLATGRDPMRRGFPSGEASYWVTRPPARSDFYKRQF